MVLRNGLTLRYSIGMDELIDISENKVKQRNTAKGIRITISAILAFTGVAILTFQGIPLGNSYIKSEIQKRNHQEIIAPVPGYYRRDIGGEFAYWDPGQSYFENLISEAALLAQNTDILGVQSGQVQRNVTIDQSYSQPMQVTIPALDIQNLNITSNVESYEEGVYNEVLKNGLAHFKGTPLPGAGGNTFIYGHSAVSSYYNNHEDDPEVAFTTLEELGIGDEVFVKKDGVERKYIVRKKKVVEPDDFTILGRQSWKETVTLMTCSPVGIGTNRLIVTAEIANE